MVKLILAFVILITLNTSSQWVKVANGLGSDSVISGITSIGGNFFAGTQGNDSSHVYISTNNGGQWTRTAFTINPGLDVNCLVSTGNNLIAGADRGLWVSTNNGANWFVFLVGTDILGLSVTGASVFAGNYSGSVQHGAYRSDNQGLNWNSSGLTGTTPYCFAKIGNNVFAGTDHFGVHISTNNGGSWSQAGLVNKHVHALAALGNTLFAGTDTGLYISSNNGSTWNISSLNTQYVFDLITYGNNILASANGDIYLSTNNGTSWIPKNEGFTNDVMTFYLHAANNYIFAGSYGKHIWRRPLGEVFGIQKISSEIPLNYSLHQNYPNPFNPSTIIRFDIPKPDFVKVIVYNNLGRELAVLVNQELQPGTYETEFDGSNYASGIYYYKLLSNEYSKTGKMVFIK